MTECEFTRDFACAFKSFLCDERKKRNLSQFKLSLRSGLSRQCLSLFEKGRRVPSMFSIFALAKGFEMPAKNLMSALLNKMELYECYGRPPEAERARKKRKARKS